jgi:hypothetical protein
VTSSLVRRPETFCWVFRGPDAALADVIGGPDARVRGEPEYVVAAVAAEFQQFAAGPLLGGVLRAGHARHARQAREDGVPELVRQWFHDVYGDGGQALLAGGAPGADQAAQRPQRLLRPDGVRVGLGAVAVQLAPLCFGREHIPVTHCNCARHSGPPFPIATTPRE